jgi:hypothetical protein
LHESGDSRNPGKLPRLVYPSLQQQQQQQQAAELSQTSMDISEISFPDSLPSAALHGPLFV